jgi:hypothetical protein
MHIMKKIATRAVQGGLEVGQDKQVPSLEIDSVSYRKDFAEAMERYRPRRVRMLFIAEAPPAYRFHRLFYFTDVREMDTLFLETMKTLYPVEVGFHNGRFLPGHTAKAMRGRKAELLVRFQSDGYFLTDAYERPMPEGASANEKAALMRASLPHLIEKVWQLSASRRLPIVLIGKITYKVCIAALRHEGIRVLNTAAIDHPGRGGQLRFREGLAQTVSVVSSY